MPRVSVIMGVYNIQSKNMLEAAISSILNQTYTDFEFIICDDGSTNNTYELLVQLTSHDKRVVLLKNAENSGLAKTLNNCLALAKGEYIARMDADDISKPYRLEKEVAFLDGNNRYSIVGCWAELIDENGIWGSIKHKEYPTKKDFLWNSQFIHPTVMLRREVYEATNGYRISKETRRAEDYDLFMRAYALGYMGYNIQDFLFQYREDVESYTKRKYKYRIDESVVRYKGFRLLKLMPQSLPFIVKPLIVGLLPNNLTKRIKMKK